MSAIKYGEASVFSGTETCLHERTRYFAFSLADGTVTEITGVGQAGAMFADGSYPKMDVSTARKPLAVTLCNHIWKLRFTNVSALCL